MTSWAYLGRGASTTAKLPFSVGVRTSQPPFDLEVRNASTGALLRTFPVTDLNAAIVSTNLLGAGLPYIEADFDTAHEVEVTIEPAGLVQITGFPTAGLPA